MVVLDSSSESVAPSAVVDAWLEPLDDAECGVDVEYENEFLELVQAAAGKPESMFGDAEPPDWRVVSGLCEALFDKTRDLRIAIYWARARLAIDTATSLPASLRLVHGLLDRYWDTLYPLPDPDDGDAYARINALTDMVSAQGLTGDFRQALIVQSRSVGELRGRDIEIAAGALEPREDEPTRTPDQIEDMLGDAIADEPAIARIGDGSLFFLDKIDEVMRDKVGYDRAPSLSALETPLRQLAGMTPAPKVQSSDDDEGGSDDADGLGLGLDGDTDGTDADADASPQSRRGGGRSAAGLSGAIHSREEAQRAIEMVCDYLERTEPTNPAQLLLRRASRLISKNFLELMRELAPESLNEVARLMGVSPDEIGDGS
jgi:type VI secretion system protein ImpA